MPHSRLILVATPVLLTLLAVALRRAWLWRLRRKFFDPLPDAYPYYARRALLTRTELAFYETLRDVVGGRFAVCMKVRLGDVIGCSDDAWKLGYGRLIAQKHLDFVVVDPKTTKVVVAIEVDDRSHAHPKRQARDHFVDLAMRAARVPLLRVPAARAYPPSRIQQALAEVSVAA
ncbi:MAG: DUF2726 domain-containing protein [Gemmataceae bacterium]